MPKLKGGQVSKVQPASAAGSKEGSSPENTTIKVVDQDGTGLPQIRWRAELPDGSTQFGVTGPDGTSLIPSTIKGTVRVTLLDKDSALVR